MAISSQPSSSSNVVDSNAQFVASSVELFKPSLPDIGWKCNSLRDRTNTKNVTCDYCLVESNGGKYMAKQHQIGVAWNVRSCKNTSEEVKLILTSHEESGLAKVKSVSYEVHEDGDETSLLQEILRMVIGKSARTEVGSISAAKKGNKKGPLDKLFYQRLEVTLEKGNQTNMKDGFSKRARETTIQYRSRFFYLNGITFNIAK
jgi:hypothetical protein